MLTVKAVGVHQQHLDKAGLMKGEVEAAAEAGEEGSGVLEEAELSAVDRLALGGGFVHFIGIIADDLIELDASEEVLV